jgi:hypothetical protein
MRTFYLYVSARSRSYIEADISTPRLWIKFRAGKLNKRPKIVLLD